MRGMQRIIRSALSLYEPWATLMLVSDLTKRKRIETRSWATAYRGPFAIHASKTLDKETCREEPFLSVLQAHFGTWDFLGMFKLGHIIGVAELLDCQPTEVLAPNQNAHELAFGNFCAGRFGFVTDYATSLSIPIPARGRQLFWSLSAEQQADIQAQLPMSGFSKAS